MRFFVLIPAGSKYIPLAALPQLGFCQGSARLYFAKPNTSTKNLIQHQMRFFVLIPAGSKYIPLAALPQLGFCQGSARLYFAKPNTSTKNLIQHQLPT